MCGIKNKFNKKRLFDVNPPNEQIMSPNLSINQIVAFFNFKYPGNSLTDFDIFCMVVQNHRRNKLGMMFVISKYSGQLKVIKGNLELEPIILIKSHFGHILASLLDNRLPLSSVKHYLC